MSVRPLRQSPAPGASNQPVLIPKQKIRNLLSMVDELWIVEEGFPEIEDLVRGVIEPAGKIIHGKLTAACPRAGELTLGIVGRAARLVA